MKIKHTPALTIALCSVCAAAAFSAGALAQGPAGPRGPKGPPPPPGGPRAERDASDSATGTVKQYLLNPRGEVDGLLLTDNTVVKFPPHMSADLARAVKPNDSVTIKGRREPSGRVKAYTITNNGNNQSVTEARPSEPRGERLPPSLQGIGLKPMQATGRIAVVLTAPRGEVEGAVLEDGTVLRVSREAADQSALFKAGGAVSVSGYGSANEMGRAIEVTAAGENAGALKPLYEGLPVTQ